MRRLLACLLLLCVGISFPVAAGGLRLCLNACSIQTLEASGCCGERGGLPADEPDCCVEWEKAPDATTPPVPPESPSVPTRTLDRVAIHPLPVFDRLPHLGSPSERIRGPASRRAMLAIWRL